MELASLKCATSGNRQPGALRPPPHPSGVPARSKLLRNRSRLVLWVEFAVGNNLAARLRRLIFGSSASACRTAVLAASKPSISSSADANLPVYWPNSNTSGCARAATPGARNVAVLVDSNTTALQHLEQLQDAARARNIALSIFAVAKPEEIGPAMDKAKASGAKALNVLARPY